MPNISKMRSPTGELFKKSKKTATTFELIYLSVLTGGGVYTGQECLPAASLFSCHRNQKTVPRRTAVALGLWQLIYASMCARSHKMFMPL